MLPGRPRRGVGAVTSGWAGPADPPAAERPRRVDDAHGVRSRAVLRHAWASEGTGRTRDVPRVAGGGEPQGGAGQRKAPDVGSSQGALAAQSVDRRRGGEVPGAMVEQLTRQGSRCRAVVGLADARCRWEPGPRCRSRVVPTRVRGDPMPRGRRRRARGGGRPAFPRPARTGRDSRVGSHRPRRRRRQQARAALKHRGDRRGRARRCALPSECPRTHHVRGQDGAEGRRAVRRHRVRRGTACTPARRSPASGRAPGRRSRARSQGSPSAEVPRRWPHGRPGVRRRAPDLEGVRTSRRRIGRPPPHPPPRRRPLRRPRPPSIRSPTRRSRHRRRCRAPVAAPPRATDNFACVRTQPSAQRQNLERVAKPIPPRGPERKWRSLVTAAATSRRSTAISGRASPGHVTAAAAPSAMPTQAVAASSTRKRDGSCPTEPSTATGGGGAAELEPSPAVSADHAAP